MGPKHATNPTLSAAEIARGKPVPWVIAAFFVSFIVPLLCFVWIAFEHKPDLVTEHAYDKGLAYNSTLKAESDMEALGWQANLSMQGNTLVMTLAGKDTKPIRGAKAEAWFIRPSKAGMDQSSFMRETAPGRYETAMPNPAPGLWQARVTAQYQGQQFQAAQEVTVR